jgi:hypothetical protein
MTGRGKPAGTPAGEKVRISVGFDPATFARLCAAAEKQGKPVSKIIRDCVVAQLASV